MSSVEDFVWRPFFQSSSHPAVSKQQMVRQGAVVHLVPPCLLGSNCGLTWREAEHSCRQTNYSHLTGRHLTRCISRSRWSWKEIYCSRCCLGMMDVCAHSLLSTCLSPQQLLVCFFIYQPVCCGVVADVFGMRVLRCKRETI